MRFEAFDEAIAAGSREAAREEVRDTGRWRGCQVLGAKATIAASVRAAFGVVEVEMGLEEGVG